MAMHIICVGLSPCLARRAIMLAVLINLVEFGLNAKRVSEYAVFRGKSPFLMPSVAFGANIGRDKAACNMQRQNREAKSGCKN